MRTVDAIFDTDGDADEEALEAARASLGPLRIEQWNTQADIDNIRHYALGLGDLNPLWHDPGYGQASSWGTTVAPPTFLYAIYDGEIAPGLGGLIALHRSSVWHFYDWVRLGQRLTATAALTDVALKHSGRGSRGIHQYGLGRYFVQQEDRPMLVADHQVEVSRMSGPGSDGGLGSEPREQHEYTPQELDEIEREVLGTKVRGKQTRWWDEVCVGDRLPSSVKGPYTRMSMICYYAGAIGSPGYRAFDAWWRNRHLAITNPEALPNTFDPAYFAGTGITAMGHHDAAVADNTGVPGTYDNGNQRIGLMLTCVTNWMSDDGFVFEYSHVFRRAVIMGDTIRFTGEVVETTHESPEADERVAEPLRGRAEVTIELSATNQLGEAVSSGRARVLLPKRV